MMAPDTERRWRGRPVAAGALRAAVIAVPVMAGLAVAWALARALPQPQDTGDLVLSWFVLIAVSTGVVLVVERLARRALPLAYLLELSLLFPGEAPSRFRIALRRRGVRDLEGQLESDDPDASSVAGTILGLVAAISAHDRRTRGHSERVRAYAAMIGEELHLDEGDVDRLHWAALLHDVGKLRVPPEILNKSGEPDRSEWKVIRGHPTEGARLAAPLMGWLGPWGQAIEQHHEHWDGSGYPNGLSGSDISLAARIVAVADAYETMTALRAYNRPMSPGRAREELARSSGAHFDPSVVRAFLGLSVAKLRRVAGPLVWVAELPMLAPLRVLAGQPAAASTASAAVGVAAVTAVAAMPQLATPPRLELPREVAVDTAAEETSVPGPGPVFEPLGPLFERPFGVSTSGMEAAEEPDVTPEVRPRRSAPVGDDERFAATSPDDGTEPDVVEVGGAGEGPSAGSTAADDGREPGREPSAATDTDDEEPVGPETDPEPEAVPASASAPPEQPPDPPEHAEADPDPDTEPGVPADPDPRDDEDGD